MGKPEEGRPVEQSPGQSAVKKRAVQEGLILKSDKYTQFQIREKEPCIDMTVFLFPFMYLLCVRKYFTIIVSQSQVINSS